jgi:hypothetical protein
MTESFKTYWLIDGVKCEGYPTMRQRVLNGATAIEVSAESQQIAAEERKRRAKANAIKDEEIRRAAAEREHAASPEGQREAARRNALTNPGGRVTTTMNPLAELDAFLPRRTSLLR